MSLVTPNNNVVFDFNSCWLSSYLLGQRASPGWNSASLHENVLINRGLFYGRLAPSQDLVCWITNTKLHWHVMITRQSLFCVFFFALMVGQLSNRAILTGYIVVTAACVLKT